ncbi:MAG: hypothetical protein WB626_06320, partial [Bacteroidota bacterium]
MSPAGSVRAVARAFSGRARLLRLLLFIPLGYLLIGGAELLWVARLAATWEKSARSRTEEI